MNKRLTDTFMLSTNPNAVLQGYHLHLCPVCKIDVEEIDDTGCPLTEDHPHDCCSALCERYYE